MTPVRALIVATALVALVCVGPRRERPAFRASGRGRADARSSSALASPPLARHRADAGAPRGGAGSVPASARPGAPGGRSVRWRYRLVRTASRSIFRSATSHACRRLPACATSSRRRPTARSSTDARGRSARRRSGGRRSRPRAQGMKIGIIDTGVDQATRSSIPAGYTMPAGFPRGQTRSSRPRR